MTTLTNTSTPTSLSCDFIDQETWNQLLELEEDEPGFVKGLISNYLVQANQTLQNMDAALY